MATNQSCEKSMKNYMYDNPELKDAKASKGCVDIEDEYGSDTDIWIVQCPKDFDPCKLMNTELSKAGKQSMEICTNRFSEKKTLAVIAPEKAAEYELICDKLKLVKPIGKIVLCEKFAVDSISSMRKSVAEKKSSKRQYQDDCSPSEDSQKCDSDDTQSSNDDSCEESEEDVRKPLANNKLQKKVDEQKFTIETTVTVEKCGQKKPKKCLPIVPPEPTPLKNKRKSKNSDELNWMKC